MKILFDHQMFINQKYGGITKYFCELMKNLPEEHQFKLSVILSDNQHLKDDKKFFKKVDFPIPKKDFKGKGFIRRQLYCLNMLYSKYNISLKNYDILHPTYFDPYFLSDLKKPYIITVHDLIEFKFKKLFKIHSRIPEMEQVIKNATRIISVSENTKMDLINILNVNPDKVDVIYHGFNKPSIEKKNNKLGRYILFVGRREGYKNFTIFVEAVSRLMSKDDSLKLICVGRPFNKAESEKLWSLKISNRTKAIGVNEKELNELYSNALTFVFPTLYEGFGMPVLEAFANNCPVCLSNTSSLPEVAGDAGLYFDPLDQDSIFYTVEKVINDSTLVDKLIIKGKIRLQIFGWRDCAEKTVSSYERTIG